MFNLKKYFTDELLQIALILSLLRIDQRSLEYNVPAIGIGTNNFSSSWDQSHMLVRREGSIHPKSVDSVLLNYERKVFYELNSLGRYSPILDALISRNLTAYLLNVEEAQAEADAAEPASSVSADDSGARAEDETSFRHGLHRKNIDSEQLSRETIKKENEDYFIENPFTKDASSDPWMGESSFAERLSDYEDFHNEEGIDDDVNLLNEIDNDVAFSAIFDSLFSFDETLPLSDLNEVDHHPIDIWELLSVNSEPDADASKEKKETQDESKEDPGIVADFFDDEELDLLTNMIHAPAPQYYHSRPFQSRSIPPYMRTVGMDQRWQDFTSMMNFSDTGHAAYHHHHHYHHHSPVTNDYSSPIGSSYSSHHMPLGLSSEASARNNVLHNSSLSPTINDLNNTSAYPALGNNCNVGTTANSSLNLTNSAIAETVITSDSTAPAFKVEPSPQESVYPFQNSCTELNQTTDGFLSSILGEDDMHLMDMAMSEGMYSMRMLDSGCTVPQNCIERGTDSDSAVSSMGSERVPSLSSDTEWMETNSDSGHTPADHYASDYCNKYRWYENYVYGNRGPTGNESSLNNASSRLSQIPQKKYQLYGRRCFQEQNTNNHVVHNHTYHMPPEAVNSATGTIHKPIYRDKLKSKSGRKSEDEQLTRDEKRARNMNIPISVYDIINLPMDEFNEKLSTYDLSEKQLSMIRDIRRRGKNKVAAQNCRKRKLDQIMSLADEVKQMKDRKHKLLQEKEFLSLRQQRIQHKYSQLYRHIFQLLRDPNGNSYSPFAFILQHAADRSVSLIPRNNNSANLSGDTDQLSAHSSLTKNKDKL